MGMTHEPAQHAAGLRGGVHLRLQVTGIAAFAGPQSASGVSPFLAEAGPKQAARFSSDRYYQKVGALYDSLFRG